MQNMTTTALPSIAGSVGTTVSKVANNTPPNNNTLPPHQIYTETYKIVSSTILFAIMALAIFGNSLVIAAFRKFRKLRTVTNYFVVSLAVADILISSFSIPIWAAHIVTGPDPNWLKIDKSARFIWTFSDIICGLASIFNLTCISIERYVCISSPLHYYQRVGGRRVNIIIVCIWIISAILAGARLVFSNTVDVFEILYTIVGFFLPLTIMIVMYSLIFRVACKQVKKMDVPTEGKMKTFRLRKEIKAAKTLGIVISAFIICWSPFFLLNLLTVRSKWSPKVRIDVVIASKWFHYINSVLNPLIYARMNKDFRDGFTRILLCCAVFIGIRENANESGLPPLDRRSSSFLASAVKRRKSSAAPPPSLGK